MCAVCLKNHYADSVLKKNIHTTYGEIPSLSGILRGLSCFSRAIEIQIYMPVSIPGSFLILWKTAHF